MDKEPLYLWCARPEDVLTETAFGACAQLLSEDEQIHLGEFRFDQHRREYLTTRALVRTALSCYYPVAPDAWRFQLNRYGKPSVNPDCGLRFNLSNSPKLAVCLISQGAEVGVDAEPCERAGEIAELGPEVFSSLELEQFKALRGAERLDRALSLWTLKEAYIKARGMGLSLPLKGFSFVFGGVNGIRLELDPSLDDKAERWRFCLLEHAGHSIALMVERVAAFDLQFLEARPPLSSARRLPGGAEPWFPLQPNEIPAERQEESRESLESLGGS